MTVLSSSYRLRKRILMFDKLFNLTSQQMGKFSDTVHDEFGQSIVSDVFDPLLRDIFALQKMRELFIKKSIDIDRLTEDLQSME